MARVQRGDIGVGDGRVLCELRLQPVDQRLAVAVEHPKRQAQRPHVLAAQRFLVAKAEGLHRVQRKLADVERDELPFGEAAVLKRVFRIARLGEVARRKLARIRSEEHTSELQSLMRISYAVFCLNNKIITAKTRAQY